MGWVCPHLAGSHLSSFALTLLQLVCELVRRDLVPNKQSMPDKIQVADQTKLNTNVTNIRSYCPATYPPLASSTKKPVGSCSFNVHFTSMRGAYIICYNQNSCAPIFNIPGAYQWKFSNFTSLYDSLV